LQNAKYQFTIASKTKISKSQMGKHLLEIRKSPCEATYQKFHLKIHVLGILFLPSTHLIGSKILAKIPFAHL